MFVLLTMQNRYLDSHPVSIDKLNQIFLIIITLSVLLFFAIVIGRTEDGGVMMEDLEALQMEFETLLNAVVIRSTNLQREIAGMTEKVFVFLM